MRSIASFQALSDHELIELARDHTSFLCGSDMHGLALVLARRLETHLENHEADLQTVANETVRIGCEHAAAVENWEIP